MNRNRIRRVVGAITGHCGLNRHLNKLRLSVTPMCSCGLEEETGIHIICECPKFLQLRRRLLGDYTVEPLDVAASDPPLWTSSWWKRRGYNDLNDDREGNKGSQDLCFKIKKDRPL